MSTSDHVSDRIRVYLVDDHPAIREALRDKVEQHMDMEICGESSSAGEAYRDIETLEPDVAVVDISLNDAHGLDLVQNVRAQYPTVRIIVFSMYDENVYAERAIRSGAAGYLMKQSSTANMIEAIRTVHDGDIYLSRKMASRMLNKVARGEASTSSFTVDELTDRELAVFQMLGQGNSIREIQDRLCLSRKTVETYRRRAKEKLGVETVSELLQYAIQWTYAQSTSDEGSPSET